MVARVDIDHLYGYDLGVTAAGDINLVSGRNLTVMRVLRRLLTNNTDQAQSDYPWQPGYGVGLSQDVGNAALDVKAIRAKVISQLFLEASVARIPIPVVDVTQISATTVQINVTYTDTSGTPQGFNFSLTP